MSNGGNGGGEFVGDTSGAGYWAYQVRISWALYSRVAASDARYRLRARFLHYA